MSAAACGPGRSGRSPTTAQTPTASRSPPSIRTDCASSACTRRRGRSRYTGGGDATAPPALRRTELAEQATERERAEALHRGAIVIDALDVSVMDRTHLERMRAGSIT